MKEKNVYHIHCITSKSEIQSGERAAIDIANWGSSYAPYSEAILCYVEKEGFFLRIWCKEENPKAVYKNADDPVWLDSCLEFFADFKPESKRGYINFEANANGALLASIGPDRGHRVLLKDSGVPHPEITPFREEDRWGYTLFIPLSLIKTLYGNADFQSGDEIRGSFYKCGDETKSPHFLSSNVICTDAPDFHRPEFFIPMILS